MTTREPYDDAKDFAIFWMFICGVMIIFCFVGMAKSCTSAENYYKNCHDAGGTVVQGGRGGEDSCFDADGRRLNYITDNPAPVKDYRKDVR